MRMFDSISPVSHKKVSQPSNHPRVMSECTLLKMTHIYVYLDIKRCVLFFITCNTFFMEEYMGRPHRVESTEIHHLYMQHDEGLMGVESRRIPPNYVVC